MSNKYRVSQKQREILATMTEDEIEGVVLHQAFETVSYKNTGSATVALQGELKKLHDMDFLEQRPLIARMIEERAEFITKNNLK